MSRTRIEDRLAASPIDFMATLVDEADRIVVVLRGELDLSADQWVAANVPTVQWRHRHIVVDCGSVTFIDAAGIRLLLRLLAPPHSRLADVPPPVSRLLRIVGLHHLVEEACPLDPVAKFDNLS